MKFRPSLSQLPIFLSMLSIAFLSLTLLVTFFSWSSQRQLAQTNYDSNGIAAVQLRLHYYQLLDELKFLELTPGADDTDAAVLQYDIVYQRLGSLPARPPYDRILDAPLKAALAGLLDGIKAEVEHFDAAAAGGRGALAGVHQRLAARRGDIDLVAGRIVQEMSAYRETVRHDIVGETRILIVLTVGIVVAGAVFAFLLWLQLRHSKTQNRELAELAAEVAAANRAKSEFLATMSHDLRTPLNAILGFSDIMLKQMYGPLGDDKYREYLEHVQGSAQHLLALVNDILDLAKLESGDYPLKDDLMDPLEFSHHIVKTFEHVSQRKKLNFEVIVSEGVPKLLKADKRVATQVYNNLLSNACRHTPEGGTISIIWDTPTADEISLAVKDTGEGIAPEILAKLSEPFVTGDAQIARQEERGTGLGLYICRKFFEARGGRMTIESEVGVGTTVTARWPAANLLPVT